MEEVKAEVNNDQVPKWFTNRIKEFNIDKTWLKVTAEDKKDLGQAYQFLGILKEWKERKLPDSHLAGILSTHGVDKVHEHLTAIEVLVGQPKDSENNVHFYLGDQFILPLAPPPPLNEADIVKLTKTLIVDVSQHYLKKYSTLTPVLHTEIGTPILQAYVNLAIVKESTKDNQERQTELLDRRYLNSHEQIYGEKKEIHFTNLFNPIEREENVNQHERIPTRLLVEGWAGIGKSVFCQFIANKWASTRETEGDRLWDGKFELMLWIPLRNLSTYTQRAYNLAEVVKAECLPNDSTLTVDQIAQIVKHMGKKLLLVLDGYDEAASWYHETNSNHGHPKQWSYRCQLLRSLIDQDTHPMIVTSRPHFVDSDLRPRFDRRLETIGFKDEDIDEYVQSYFHRVNQDHQGATLLIEMRTQPILREAAYVPVNLSLMCLIWNSQYKKTNFPAQLTLTRLYSEIVLCLLRRDYCERLKRKGRFSNDGTKEKFSEATAKLECLNWDIVDLEQDLDYGLMLQWLEEIAWKNQCISKGHSILMPGQDLYEFLKAKSIPPGQILTKIQWLKKLGLLNERFVGKGIRENDYYFPHLTFQEYFAALYLAKRYIDGNTKAETEDNLYKFKFNKRFEVVWQFVVGVIVVRKPMQVNSYFKKLSQPPRDITGINLAKLLILAIEQTDQASAILGNNFQIKLIIDSYLYKSMCRDDNRLSKTDTYSFWARCWKLMSYYRQAILSAMKNGVFLEKKIDPLEIFEFVEELPDSMIHLIYFDHHKTEWSKREVETYLDCGNNVFDNYQYVKNSYKYKCQLARAREKRLWRKLNTELKTNFKKSNKALLQSLYEEQVIRGLRFFCDLPWEDLAPQEKKDLLVTLTSINEYPQRSRYDILYLIERLFSKKLLPDDITLPFSFFNSFLTEEDEFRQRIAFSIIATYLHSKLSEQEKIEFFEKLKSCNLDVLRKNLILFLKNESLSKVNRIIEARLIEDGDNHSTLLCICFLPEDLPYFQPRSNFWNKLFKCFLGINKEMKMRLIRELLYYGELKFTDDQKRSVIENINDSVDFRNQNSRELCILFDIPPASITRNLMFLLSLWDKIKDKLLRFRRDLLPHAMRVFERIADAQDIFEIKNAMLMELCTIIDASYPATLELDKLLSIYPYVNMLRLNTIDKDKRLSLLRLVEFYLIKHKNSDLNSLFNGKSLPIFINDGPSECLCHLLYRYAIKESMLIKSRKGGYIICDEIGDAIELPDSFTDFMNKIGEDFQGDSSCFDVSLLRSSLPDAPPLKRSSSSNVGFFNRKFVSLGDPQNKSNLDEYSGSELDVSNQDQDNERSSNTKNASAKIGLFGHSQSSKEAIVEESDAMIDSSYEKESFEQDDYSDSSKETVHRFDK